MFESDLTVRHALTRAEAFLTERGVDSPRLSAQALLAHVLGIERLELFLEMDRALGPDELERFRKRVFRRGQGEPLAHIVGSREFYGLDFLVTPDTLIPRPETELLIERLEARFSREAAFRFADLGTGSGCLAVTAATLFPRASGVAVDISEAALAAARENARRHGVADRLAFPHGDFGVLAGLGESFDVILANPPYVALTDRESLSPEVRDFEPAGALFGGPDGLEAVRAVIALAGKVLRPGGVLLLEFGWDQGEAVRSLCAASGAFSRTDVLRDLAGHDRAAEAVIRE